MRYSSDVKIKKTALCLIGVFSCLHFAAGIFMLMSHPPSPQMSEQIASAQITQTLPQDNKPEKVAQR